MAFILDKVVPWGRSFDEYISMFSLSQQDLKKNFLGCRDGPANFNSVLTNRGGRGRLGKWQNFEKVTLNLVTNGKDTVWVGDVVLSKSPLKQSGTEQVFA